MHRVSLMGICPCGFDRHAKPPSHAVARLEEYGTNALRDELRSRGDMPQACAAYANSLHEDQDELYGDKPRLLSDDQLRAECERRGLTHNFATFGTFKQVQADGAEWKRRADAFESAALGRKSQAEFDAVVAERDSLVVALRERNVIARLERGPGIAASPSASEPLAHLDEDLLCEDA